MIRAGEVTDIPDIVKMADSFWEHTIYDEPFQPVTVALMAENSIRSKLMSVLEIDGKVVGFAAGVLGNLLANNDAVCGTEVAWWVDPEHRGGKNGISLLKHIESLAKEAGVKYWNMAFMESSMPDVIEDIYKRLGYTRSEVIYTRVL